MDLADCNCLAVRQAARQITQLYDAELASTGLRATQFALLAQLGRSSSTVQGLADLLLIDRTTIGHNLRPLERDGLVVIVADEADRRVRRLELTTAGKKKLASARAGWERAQRRFHENFGTTQARGLRATLRRAADAARVD